MKLIFLSILSLSSSVGMAQERVKEVTNDSTQCVADSVDLKEVTITSKQSVYRMKEGSMITKVQNSTLSSAGTGRDVLKHIPGIKVTEEEYEVNGKGTPEIYIDNHKINNIAEIERLSSKDIDHVEVIRQPGAEYGATVTAVIRITTTQKRKENFGIDARSVTERGRKTSNREQINLDYQHKGLKLNGFAYYALDQDKRIMSTTYDIRTTDILKVRSNTNIIDRGNVFCWSGGMNYDFDKDHSIGLSYEYDSSPDFSMKGNASYFATRNNIAENRTNQNDEIKIKDGTHLINAFYLGKIKEMKIDFTSDIVVNHSRTNQNIDDGTDIIVTSNGKDFSNLYAARLVLSHPLLTSQMRIGGDYSFISRRNWFLNEQDILPSADNKIHESKTAGFTEYAVSIGKTDITAGLRYERSDTRYWDADVLSLEQSKTYNDWLPNVSVNFPIGSIQSSVSYTAKKKRPYFYQLQSNLSYNNSYIYEGGNPLLVPETDHNAECDLSYKWLMLQLSYQYAKNFIAFNGRNYDKNPDVAIFTVNNFDYAQFANASFYLSPKISWWSPVFGVDFTQSFFTAIDNGESKKMDNPMFNFTFNNTLNIGKTLIVNLDMSYNTGGDYGPCHSEAYQTVNFGIRKTLMKDALSVHLQLNDIFVCHQNFSLYSNKLTYSKNTIPDSRQAVLTIRYTFNPDKTKLKENHASEEDIKRIK